MASEAKQNLEEGARAVKEENTETENQAEGASTSATKPATEEKLEVPDDSLVESWIEKAREMYTRGVARRRAEAFRTGALVLLSDAEREYLANIPDEETLRRRREAVRTGNMAILSDRDKDKVLDLLPDEVLERFLDFHHLASNPHECVNLAKRSSGFRRILEPSRTTWLFHLVYPILLPYLSFPAIATCRLASREWRRSSDHYLGNWRFLDPLIPNEKDNPLPKILQQNPSYLQLLRWKEYTDKLDEYGDNFEVQNYYLFMRAEKIEKWMTRDSSNPFLSRSVLFNQGSKRKSYTNSGFWPTALPFLKRFGTKLLYLRLEFEAEMMSLPKMMNIVKGCLTYCPNLKGFNFEIGEDYESTFLRARLPVSKIKRDYERRPFPQLVHLERLELPVTWDHKNYAAWEEIAHFPSCYFQNLRSLDMDTAGIFGVLPLDPNPLEHLAVLNRISDLQNLNELNCPLQRLSLELNCEWISLGECFHFVRRFGETLTHLELSVNRWKDGDPKTVLEKVTFPKLRMLRIGAEGGGIENFNDLLLISDSLPPFYLDLDVFSDRLLYPEDGPEHVQILGYGNRMYESVIWRLMPALRRLSFFGYNQELWRHVHKVYSREGYENFQKLPKEN